MEFINKVVFVAPPFKGAPDAVSALTLGQGMFFNHDDTRKLARTLPALFELLPTYDFSAIDSVTGEAVNLWMPDNWQKNLVTLVGRPDKDRSIKKFIKNLKKAKIQLDKLKRWREKLTETEERRILVLVKTSDKTLCNVMVEKHAGDGNPDNYFDFKRSLHYEEGDGTVPNVSSCCYAGELVTYAFDNRPFLDDYKHPFLLKDNRVQRIINSFLKTDEDTTAFKPEIIGRTMYRVNNIKEVEIQEEGIKHRVWKLLS
jgi:hypothetical protein